VDSAVAWTTWITLMGCAGLTVLALAGVTGPARRSSAGTLPRVTARLARLAAALAGLARNEAYQAQPAVYHSAPAGSLPKLPAKQASASTWAWGAGETAVVAAVMLAGYRASGRVARRRVLAVAPAAVQPGG
jgi:hypothetical protein